MHLHRHIADELTKITTAATLPPSYIFNFIEETYATSQMVIVRRQADLHPRAASLGKLASEIAANPTTITRDFYVSEWGEDDAAAANTAFDRLSGAGGEYVDGNAVQSDLEEMRETVSAVTKYVNQEVAHRDARAKARIPTFPDLNGAIDAIGSLYKGCYRRLFPGQEYGDLVPVIADHNWKAVFTVPWIESMPTRNRVKT